MSLSKLTNSNSEKRNAGEKAQKNAICCTEINQNIGRYGKCLDRQRMLFLRTVRTTVRFLSRALSKIDPESPKGPQITL